MKKACIALLTKAFNNLRDLVFGATREALLSESTANGSVVTENDDKLRSKPERKCGPVLSGEFGEEQVRRAFDEWEETQEWDTPWSRG